MEKADILEMAVKYIKRLLAEKPNQGRHCAHTYDKSNIRNIEYIKTAGGTSVI